MRLCGPILNIFVVAEQKIVLAPSVRPGEALFIRHYHASGSIRDQLTRDTVPNNIWGLISQQVGILVRLDSARRIGVDLCFGIQVQSPYSNFKFIYLPLWASELPSRRKKNGAPRSSSFLRPSVFLTSECKRYVLLARWQCYFHRLCALQLRHDEHVL